ISHRVSYETILPPISAYYWCYRIRVPPAPPYSLRNPVPKGNAPGGYSRLRKESGSGIPSPKRNQQLLYSPSLVSILLHADNRPLWVPAYSHAYCPSYPRVLIPNRKPVYVKSASLSSGSAHHLLFDKHLRTLHSFPQTHWPTS